MASRLRLLFAVSSITALCVAAATPGWASAHNPLPAASALPHWQPQGPTGGYLLGVATSPDFATDHTVYATGAGGIFVSHDGAASWQPANKGLGSQIIRFVAVAGRGTTGSPLPRTLIVNSVDGVVATSIDGGASWKTSAPSLAGQSISALAPSPEFSHDGTVFAGTSEGALYRSMDGTASWARVHAPLAGKPMVMDVAISPSYAHDRTVVMATASGLVGSQDGGSTWRGLATRTPAKGTAGGQPAGYDAVLFSPNYASDHTIYAGGDTLIVSHDGGVHWQTLGEVASGLAVRGLFISPAFALDGTMVAVASVADARGVGSALLSRDRGKSWKPFGGLIAANDVYGVAFSPSYAADHLLYAAGAGVGLLTSADSGHTWSIANRGLYDQIINSIAVSPAFAADHTIYASAVGSGLYISPAGGGAWRPAGQNINSHYAVNSVALSPQFSRDHAVFLGAINAYLQSADGGKTWDLSYASLPDQDVHKIVVSPTYARDHTVVALGSKIDLGAYVPTVFATADRGLTWSENDSGIEGELTKAAAFSPNYALDHTMFVGTGSVGTNGAKGGVYVTHDSGETWSLAGNSFSGFDVLSLTLSPRYPTDPTLFAGTSKGLYVSHDAGSTWQAAQKLRDKEIAALILSPTYSTDGVVFAGGASGLYKSTDRGQTWASIGIALPSPRVTALAASANYAVDHLLFVGTPNSLWSAVIAPSGPATPLPTSVIGLGF